MNVNLDGILFRVWSFGLVMFLLGLVILIAGGRKYRKIGIVTMAFCVLYMGCHLWIYAHPEIAVCEGTFVSETWYRRVAPHTKAYVFEMEDAERERFYLDLFTRKSVIPFELQEGRVYRFSYEAKTNIITAMEPAQ